MTFLFFLLIGFMLVAFGALMIVTGQSISCFVAIEKNTRATHEIIKTQMDRTRSIESPIREKDQPNDEDGFSDNLFK